MTRRVWIPGVLALAACGPAEPRLATSPSRHDPRCLAVRGCPAAAPLPACTESAPETALAGQRVTLRGKLAAAERECTLLYCPGHCCNQCAGPIELSTADDLVILSGAGLATMGDESISCYQSGAPGQVVVARGILRHAPRGRLALDDAELCIP